MTTRELAPWVCLCDETFNIRVANWSNCTPTNASTRPANRRADIPLSNSSLLVPVWRFYIYGLNRTKTGTLYVAVSEQRGYDCKIKKWLVFKRENWGTSLELLQSLNASKRKKSTSSFQKKKRYCCFDFFYHFQAILSDVICLVCNSEYASDKFWRTIFASVSSFKHSWRNYSIGLTHDCVWVRKNQSAGVCVNGGVILRYMQTKC